MSQLPKFLTKKGLIPNVEINSNLNLLGTESAFDFGSEVVAVENSGKFEKIYKFHIGDTGPTTPEPIIRTAIKALRDKQTKYAPFLGYGDVRKNIAQYWSQTRGVGVGEDNVMLMPGGKPAIELSIQALVGQGDKIVAQNPGFPIYESLSRFYTVDGYIPWLAHKDETTGKIDFRVEDLKRVLSQNSNIKLLIINTPQNPTGTILSKEKLEAIAELVREYKFMVLFDDIYDNIIFGDNKHFSFLSIPDMFNYSINLNGFSKNFAMTGWRLGFVVAPEWVIEIFGRLAINKWSCVNRVNQIVAGAVFGDVEVNGFKYESIHNEIKSVLSEDYSEYEKKGKFVENALNLLNPFITVNKAEGAFYLFPNFEKILELKFVREGLNIKSASDFSKWLLNEKGIAVLAGSGFGEAGQGFIRISYAEDRESQIIPGFKYLLEIIVDLIERSGKVSPLKKENIPEKIFELKNKYFI